MGVTGFSSVFSSAVVQLDRYRGTKCAIDAMGEIFKAQAGIAAAGLTNKAGVETGYINVIFSTIVKFTSLHIEQIWVFDYDTRNGDVDNHRRMKRYELAHRAQGREKAKQKLEEIKVNEEQLYEAMSVMSEEEKKTFLASIPNLDLEKAKLEQRTTMVNSQKIDTVKKLLNLLGIQWMEAPITYEGEHLCAALNIAGVVEWVYSADVDSIIHGAPIVVRKEGKGVSTKYCEYNLANILQSNKINRQELACIAICLGTDYNERKDNKIVKPPHIGPGTVLAKFRTVDYKPYEAIYIHYMRDCDFTKVTVHNGCGGGGGIGSDPRGVSVPCGIGSDQWKAAIDYLVSEFDFSLARLNNLVHKNLGFFEKIEIKRKARITKEVVEKAKQPLAFVLSEETLAQSESN